MGFTIGLGLRAARGDGAAGTGTGAGTGGGGTTPAPLTAVAAEGWRAAHAGIAAFTPGESFTIARPGFDAAGQPVTVSEEIAVTARVRLPWPDQDVLTADEVALSDAIRAGDAVEGAANGSLLPMPRPVAMWLHSDRARAQGGAFTARLAVAHRYARSGRPVAAVRLIASDGANAVEALVSRMEVADYAASGLSVPHFAAELDLSALAPDALVTLDAVIYPWVGEAFDTRVHGAPEPSISFGTMRILNAVAPAPLAYVDGAGSDAAGAVSADPAAAAASPFATLAAAAIAVGPEGTVRLNPGSHMLSAFAGAPLGESPLRIEAADPAARDATIVQAPATALQGSIPDRLHLKDLTLRKGTATNYYVFDAKAPAGGAHMIVAENCRFDDAGFGRMGSNFLARVGRCWLIECAATADETPQASSTFNKACNLIGCGDHMGGTAVYNAVGCGGRDLYLVSDGYGVGDREVPAGQIFGWSHFSRNSLSRSTFEMGRPIGPEGLALVGCVFEGLDGSRAVIGVNNDGNLDPAENALVQQCTVVGQRANFLYQDAGTARVDKEGSIRFSVFEELNTKSDVFGRDGNLTGNWGAIHRAGFRSNAVLRGDSSGNGAPGVGHWLGEIAEAGTAIGSPAAPLDPAWADDASATGSGLGLGDYRPGAGHDLPRVPASLAPYPADMTGAPVPDDGTAVVGARQP